MTARQRIVLCFSLLVALGSSAAVQAQESDSDDSTRARELYLEGDRFYREGRYEQAVEAFREAYELSERPQLLYNMANAYERLNRLREAGDALEQYLPHAPAEDRSAVESRLTALRARMEAQEANASGDDQEEDGVRDRERPPPPQPRSPDVVGPAVLLGLGGASLVAAGLMGAFALVLSDSTATSCMDVGARTLCSEGARANVESAQGLALATDITWAAGAALAGIGLVWLIVELTSSSGGDAPSPAAVSLGPDYAGLSLQASF